MNKIINKLKESSLSGTNIMELLENRSKIIKYGNIRFFRHIDEILNDYDNAVILYETKKNYGHWVCIMRRENGELEFFDPYGYFIDDQLSFIPKNYAKSSGQNKRYLSALFYNSPYNIVINKVSYQSKNKKISTCGRHVILRIVLKDMSLKEYHDIFKNDNMTPDDKVTYLTALI